MLKRVVLAVDGDALVRISAVHIVTDAGCLALDAPSAECAIAILERRSDIRAVFTDINMTGTMDGLKLAHAIRGRWPPIHLIVTSGLNVQDLLPANSLFVPKPYSAEQVTAALHSVFDSSPSLGGFPDVDGRNCGRVA